MDVSRRDLIGTAAMTATLSSLAGCGTILYPERRGQSAGQLDPAVVILDGIGLLFFFIPGVIAFAVDFNNGTIYLPGTQTSEIDDETRQVQFDGPLTEAKLNTAWQETYGDEKPFSVRDLERKQLDDVEQLGFLFQPFSGKT